RRVGGSWATGRRRRGDGSPSRGRERPTSEGCPSRSRSSSWTGSRSGRWEGEGGACRPPFRPIRSLARRGAVDVVVPEVPRAVTRPRRRKHPMSCVERGLPPGVHRGAVRRVLDVGPHAGPVRAGGYGVYIVAEELVVHEPPLRGS